MMRYYIVCWIQASNPGEMDVLMDSMDSSESPNTCTSSAKVAFLVLMGLPGSGKTTLCFTLPHFLGSKYHIIHICYDQVIPFKEDRSWEENHCSWKDERAKVVQATETLVCNLLGVNTSGNDKCTHEKETFQDKHKLTPNINYSCIDKDLQCRNSSDDVLSMNMNIADHIDSEHEEASHSSQNMDSSFSLECSIISNKGHYTMLNSISDILSIFDRISKCDLKNELFVICVDDNCYYRSMRKEWWNLAAKYELPFCIVTLKCEVELCVRRVSERLHSYTFYSPNVPETVIGRMDQHLEIPDGRLYPWEKHSIVIDSNSLNIHVDTMFSSPISSDRGLILDRFSLESLNRIKQLMNASLLEPAKSLSKERHSNNTSVTSVIHIADLALRKIVSKSDSTTRAQVNIKRKNILEDLRNGKLIIPSDAIEEFKDGFLCKLEEYMATLITLYN